MSFKFSIVRALVAIQSFFLAITKTPPCRQVRSADEAPFFLPAGLTGVWTYWPPSSSGGRFENSPAVDCRVRIGDCISPAGTAESPMSYASSYCLFRTKDRPGIVQPSLRDFGYLLPNPTLERVGYSRISLREISGGCSRISSPGDVSCKTHRLQQQPTRKCPSSRHHSEVWHHSIRLRLSVAPGVFERRGEATAARA